MKPTFSRPARLAPARVPASPAAARQTVPRGIEGFLARPPAGKRAGNQTGLDSRGTADLLAAPPHPGVRLAATDRVRFATESGTLRALPAGRLGSRRGALPGEPRPLAPLPVSGAG